MSPVLTEALDLAGQGLMQKASSALASKQLPYTVEADLQAVPLDSKVNLPSQSPITLPSTVGSAIRTPEAQQNSIHNNLSGGIPVGTTSATPLGETQTVEAGYSGQVSLQGARSFNAASAKPSGIAAMPHASSIMQTGGAAAVNIPLPSITPVAQGPAAVPSAVQPISVKPVTTSTLQGLPQAYTTAILRPADKIGVSQVDTIPNTVEYTRPVFPVALASTRTSNAAAAIPLGGQESVPNRGSAVPSNQALAAVSKQALENALAGTAARLASQGVLVANQSPQDAADQVAVPTGAAIPVQPMVATLWGSNIRSNPVPTFVPAVRTTVPEVPTYVPAVPTTVSDPTVPLGLPDVLVPTEYLVPTVDTTIPSDTGLDVGSSVPAEAQDTMPDPALQGKWDLPYSMTGGQSGTSLNGGGADLLANVRGAFIPSSAPEPELPPTPAEVGPQAVQADAAPSASRDGRISAQDGKYDLPGQPGAFQSSVRGGAVASLPASVYPTAVGELVMPKAVGVGNLPALPIDTPSNAVVSLPAGTNVPVEMSLEG